MHVQPRESTLTNYIQLRYVFDETIEPGDECRRSNNDKLQLSSVSRDLEGPAEIYADLTENSQTEEIQESKWQNLSWPSDSTFSRMNPRCFGRCVMVLLTLFWQNQQVEGFHENDNESISDRITNIHRWFEDSTITQIKQNLWSRFLKTQSNRS